jgi:hypothetical protein
MAALRQDVLDSVAAFSAMLTYAESVVQRAPAPVNITRGVYLAAPTP